MNPILSKRVGVLVAAVLLTAAGCSNDSSSSKESVVPGTITGTVTSSSGAAIAGAVVTPSPAGVPATTTDSSGKYTLSVLPGDYTLSFTADNYEPATQNVTVGTGAGAKADQKLQASTLKVTVNLPAALKSGGPSGFNTTVSGITASAQLNGADVTPDSVTWSIVEAYDNSNPPAAVTPNPATGTTTSFTIPDFETVREGANAWMSARYGGAEFEYIQAPERDQLLSIGTQQVRAMSFKVVARVTASGHTSTGSATVSPVTISSGGNYQPLGMMVVANAPSTATYAWTLEYLPATATSATFGPPPAGVTLQGADTKNPTLVPTATGIYKLANGSDAPLYFRVSTYHGAGNKDTDAGTDGIACAECHTGQYALTDKFDEWRNSAHGNHTWKDPSATPASLFKLGLSGFEGSHYSESCVACHAVGYSKVPSAQNGGFDDIMKSSSWTFPTPPDTLDTTFAAFNAMPDGLKYRAAIQCESCHGPLEPTEHAQPEGVPALFALPVSPVASMDAGICLQCHDALTHHDRGPLWAASGHSNTELAIEDGGADHNGPNTSCARCHSGEGFVKYLAYQKAGYADPAAAYNPAEIKDGWTADVVGLANVQLHAQTCQACHDPHSTELRVEGDTKLLAGMFRVQNAGAGALCMVCHNSRSGQLKEDGALKPDGSAEFLFAASNLSRLGPHAAAQADMFAGRNAYFIPGLKDKGPTELPYLTKHSFMADACVDCHVKWVPEDIKSQYQVWNTNHTFRSSVKVCAECHADGIGERVQEGMTEKIATLQAAIGSVLEARLSAGFSTTKGTPAVVDKTVAAGAVRAVVPSQTGTNVTVALNDGTSFTVGLGALTASGTTTSILDLSTASTPAQILVRAYFNMLFVGSDGSKGLHNPSFAAAVLDNATAAVSAVTLPLPPAP